MTVQNLPGSQLTPASPNEPQLKRQQFLKEFPLAIAPYSRNHLLGFGFAGGIVGAGISAAVNLRRSNQTHAIHNLLLLTLALLILGESIFIVIVGIFIRAGNRLDAGVLLLLGNGINIGVGVLFALWCTRRQHLLSQRWREFAEMPRWHEQGGWLVALGWLSLSLILGNLVISSVYTEVGQTAFGVMFPQQRYSAHGVSVTLPAGWNPLSPEQFTTECATTGFTCLVDAEDNWDGFSATLFLVTDPEVTAASVATEMAGQVHTQYPWLPKLSPHPFSLQFVRDREALTFSGNVNSVTFIATTIADGSSVISFILNCPDAVAAQCQSLRDQIVATLEFASPA